MWGAIYVRWIALAFAHVFYPKCDVWPCAPARSGAPWPVGANASAQAEAARAHGAWFRVFGSPRRIPVGGRVYTHRNWRGVLRHTRCYMVGRAGYCMGSFEKIQFSITT